MNPDQKIDIDFLKDKSTFEKIQFQKAIFIELFTEIANQYPQSKLIKLHPEAKGSKVSKGINLDNCPYQVLDIIRVFDMEKAFNIRVLNWWGHGLYILIQFGREIAVLNERLIFERISEFSVAFSKDPFDYKTILTSKDRLLKNNFEDHLDKFSCLVLFKEIAYQTTITKQKEILLENINLILDKDS